MTSTKAHRLLKLLADNTRYQVLSLIGDGESRTVNEIAEIVGTTQPNLSHNLMMLKSNDVIESQRDGRTNLYVFARTDEAKFVKAVLKLIPTNEVETPKPKATKPKAHKTTRRAGKTVREARAPEGIEV